MDTRDQPVLSGDVITMEFNEAPYSGEFGYVTYGGVIRLESADFISRSDYPLYPYIKITGKTDIGGMAMHEMPRRQRLVDVKTWQYEIELHGDYPISHDTLRGTYRWMDNERRPVHQTGGLVDTSRWQFHPAQRQMYEGTFSTASMQANDTTERLVNAIFAEQEKAKSLLMSDLDEAQLAQYKDTERFTVTAKSGRRYEVLPHGQSNVNEFNEDGLLIRNWCLAQNATEPIADLQYAIKKLIEWDEERFRRIAIPRGGRGNRLYDAIMGNMVGGVDFAQGDNISVTLVNGDTETDITEHVVARNHYAARPTYAVPETDLERIALDAQQMAESTGMTLEDAMDRLVQAVGRQSEAYERLGLVTGNSAESFAQARLAWLRHVDIPDDQVWLVNQETGVLIERFRCEDEDSNG